MLPLRDRFSTDEGQCWGVYNFTNEPIQFTGLASEPGARSMNVSLWGYSESVFSQYWVSFTIDFRELLTRECEPQNHSNTQTNTQMHHDSQMVSVKMIKCKSDT